MEASTTKNSQALHMQHCGDPEVKADVKKRL
jgi:hypothetical protein